MAFSVRWDDDDKRVIRYRAQGVWNWNDFHKHVRLSTFALDRVRHPVETIVDLSGSARLPAGAIGHLRSLGKSDHPNRRPRAVIIGVPEDVQRQLGAVNGVYQVDGQLIRFVDTNEDARRIIGEWQEN